MRRWLGEMAVVPVLTAHPTEVQRRSIQDCEREISNALLLVAAAGSGGGGTAAVRARRRGGRQAARVRAADGWMAAPRRHFASPFPFSPPSLRR